MLKTYNLSKETYFFIAAEARRGGLPFGGHLYTITALDASDSGAKIIDHLNTSGGLDKLCWGAGSSIEQCQPAVERFLRNGTWLVPTLTRAFYEGVDEKTGAGGKRSQPIFALFGKRAHEFWAGSLLHGN